MEKYTAKLGPLGEPGPSGIGGRPDMRNLNIHDASGALVKSLQVKDDRYSINGAVRREGFALAGSWVDGECQLTKVPASVRRNKLIIGSVVAVAVVAGVTGWVSAQYAAQEDPAQAIAYCKDRAIGAAPANGGSWNGEVVGEWTANKMAKSNNKRYSKAWAVGGAMPQNTFSWADTDVRFTCFVYVNSSGDVLDGTMSIHGL